MVWKYKWKISKMTILSPILQLHHFCKYQGELCEQRICEILVLVLWKQDETMVLYCKIAVRTLLTFFIRRIVHDKAAIIILINITSNSQRIFSVRSFHKMNKTHFSVVLWTYLQTFFSNLSTKKVFSKLVTQSYPVPHCYPIKDGWGHLRHI